MRWRQGSRLVERLGVVGLPVWQREPAITTDGLWPFRVTSRREGQIERIYDAEAYLPLPLGRWAALTGRVMPGTTRQQANQHTYRYHFDLEKLQALIARKALPLTA